MQQRGRKVMSERLTWFLAGAACASMAWFLVLMAINEGLLQVFMGLAGQ